VLFVEAALSADQVLLAETAAQMAAEIGCPPPPALPTADDDEAGWRLLAGTGFVAMHLDEASGGGGAHSSDVALVVEALARRQCLVPFVGQGVLAPELLWRAGAPAELLTAVADGSRRITVAFDESLHGLARCGAPAVAWDARGATHAVVLGARGELCLTPVDGEVLPQVDITRVVRRVGTGGSCAPLSGSSIGADALVRVEALALAMLAADLVGVMQSAVDAAVDYVKQRHQFGVAVGTFQAVQHLAADAKVLLEGARSSLWYAAWVADELPPAEALLAAQQAKAYASRVGREVVELQTQLLGGIAITWEERAHVRVRRVLLDRATLGTEHELEDRIAATRLAGTGDAA
jgi:alkylation response protein AidB-like acyl-CoA dehydrogenase